MKASRRQTNLLTQLGFGLLTIATAVAGPIVAGPIALTPSAQAQQVVNVAPTGQDVPNNSTVAWQFDNAALVDGTSIKVFFNNTDVTGQSILDVTRNYFGYRPAQTLAPGSYEVRVEFKNKQGTGYTAKWPFAVANTKLEILSVTHNAADKPLGKDASFLATINGTPGATASVLLVQNGQTVRSLPASQVSSGVYVASVSVGASDNVREGVLVGRLQSGDRVVYSVASQAFTFNPGTIATPVTQTPTTPAAGPTPAPTTPAATPTLAPLAVAITSHADNGGVKGSFTLQGTATPGSNVLVTVKASAPSVGGFLTIGADELVLDRQAVTVDAAGKFSVNVPRALVIQKGTTYTVTTTATRGLEEKSTTLRLRQQ